VKRYIPFLVIPLLLLALGATTYRSYRVGVQNIRYGGGKLPQTMISGVVRYADGVTPVNVLGFGVDNTGATDCADSLQAVMDSVAAWGGTDIYMPNGTYYVESVVTLPSHVTIRGGGLTTILKDTTGTRFAFYGIDIEDIVLRDLKFTSADTTTFYSPSGLDGFVGFLDCSDIVVENCTFDNSESDGVYVGRSNGESINISVVNNWFYDCRRDGIALTDVRGGHVTGNYLEDIYGAAIDLEPNAGSIVRNVSITGNVVQAYRGNACDVAAAYRQRALDVGASAVDMVYDITVNGNIFTVGLTSPSIDDTKRAPVVDIVFAENVAITGNVISTNIPTSDTNAGALWLYNSSNIRVTDNTIVGPTLMHSGQIYGMYFAVKVASSNATIYRNLVFNNNISGRFNYGYGIYQATGVSIDGVVYGPTEVVYGAMFSDCTNVKISGVYSVNSYPVRLDNARSVSIIGANLYSKTVDYAVNATTDTTSYVLIDGVTSDDVDVGASPDTLKTVQTSSGILTDVIHGSMMYAPMDTTVTW
jgi:hypothetical protein